MVKISSASESLAKTRCGTLKTSISQKCPSNGCNLQANSHPCPNQGCLARTPTTHLAYRSQYTDYHTDASIIYNGKQHLIYLSKITLQLNFITGVKTDICRETLTSDLVCPCSKSFTLKRRLVGHVKDAHAAPAKPPKPTRIVAMDPINSEEESQSLYAEDDASIPDLGRLLKRTLPLIPLP